MCKTKYAKNPRIFLPEFRKVDHQNPTRFSKTVSVIKDLLVKPPALQ